MKRFLSLIIMLIAVNTFAGEPSVAVRIEAFSLLKTLQVSDVVNSSSEEYANFTATLNEADQLHHRGEDRAADQLFSLAILKGKLLLKSPEIPRYPAAVDSKQYLPVFTSLSSVDPVKPVQLPELNAAPVATVPSAVKKASYFEKKSSARIIGGKGVYTVRKNDTLRLVASKLGVNLRDLTRKNHLKADTPLFPGQQLEYNNRRIVPKSIKDGIVVNIPDRSLYLFHNGRLSASYPVAVGMAKKKESTAWRTPVGRFQIVDKKMNPTWRIPISIQKEMEENGEEVLEFIPPGPKNPLGKYALKTDLSGIVIHSTTRPTSINSFSSHGCIRVMPDNMERLFKSVSVSMQGEIIYKPVKVEVTGNGKVFLEVNRDSYEMFEDLAAEVRKAIKKHHADSKVSWQMVKKVTKEESGIAEDVTLGKIPD
jgi:lipoprotein-anchoring transpeptidase ErfK/SrfK